MSLITLFTMQMAGKYCGSASIYCRLLVKSTLLSTLEELNKELNLSHPPTNVQKLVRNLVIEYWSFFADRGLLVPLKDYECIINTGTAQPISVSKINYAPRKTPIMCKCIAALYELG